MIQAARSGRQNIAEASRASATSAQSELKLTNVARASLDELLLDYEDFLRQRGLPVWDKNADLARRARSLARMPSDSSDSSDPYAPWLHHENPTIVANTVICLIHQANYLLDHQLAKLETQFGQEGGFAERLSVRRRSATSSEPESDETPACPLCGKPMVLRTARNGSQAGTRFWGCRLCPDCRGTRKTDG